MKTQKMVFMNFYREQFGKIKPVCIIHKQHLSDQEEKTKQALRVIVRTVTHCARTNSSFRGHNEKLRPLPGEF